MEILLKGLFLFLFTGLCSLVFSYSMKHLKKTSFNNFHYDLLVKVFSSLSVMVVWIYGLLSFLIIFFKNYPIVFSSNDFVMARRVFLIVLISWLLFRWKKEWEKAMYAVHQFEPAKKALYAALAKCLTILLFFFAAILILDVLGVSLEVLLTFGGIGSIAVSLAAKDVIANFFGGLMIHVTRPFSIGELVKSTNKDFFGVVEEIGWYMTRLRSLERKILYVPNAVITDAIIENWERMYNRRLKFIVGVRYDDFHRMQGIIEKVRNVIFEHQDIDQMQRKLVHFSEFGASSLDIEVIAFTKATQYDQFSRIREDILLKVGQIVEEAGAEIAFPTRTLHIEGSDGSL